MGKKIKMCMCMEEQVHTHIANCKEGPKSKEQERKEANSSQKGLNCVAVDLKCCTGTTLILLLQKKIPKAQLA
jgi:hypothetical protein